MSAQRPLRLVDVAEASDTGLVRSHNEDSLLATPELIAVADGMGGAQAGEVASRMTVERLEGVERPHADSVREAVQHANADIRDMAETDSSKAGMGTTVTAALIDDGYLDVVHVGDSRAYLWRAGELHQLSEDHSVVWELVKRGSITPEEAEHHPHRNVITRAVGAERQVRVDVRSHDVREGDVVLLCSDGLSAYVPEDEIEGVLAGTDDLQAIAAELVERANGKGGHDNVTVVLARVAEGAQAGDGEDTLVVEGEGRSGTTSPMRVLGGVRGHQGSERLGSSSARRTQILQPVARRSTRIRPAFAAVAVVLALIVGGVAWVASRTYVVEAGPDGTVRVANGFPLGIGGLDLAVPWQETGVPVESVRRNEPGALRRRARGQGEAVELAARLVWEFTLPAVEDGQTTPVTPTPAP